VFQPHRILHPTDFSASSHYAYRIALDLARLYQAPVVVLHVVETLGPENVTYGEATSQLEPESYRQRLQAELERTVGPPPAGVAIEFLLAEGNPETAIERTVAERHCDLIVMGTHGHTGLSRLFMGSIAEKVVRRAPCPVLVCKLPHESSDVV
jgi:nucleotide-binding universal stress UspA family protein